MPLLGFGSGVMQLNMSIETMTTQQETQLESGVFGFVFPDQKGFPTK